MAEPLEEAAVADDLSLLDFIDPAETAAKNPSSILFDDLLDSSVDSVLPGLPPPPAEQLEELEWLSNKDAFPPLDTSFEVDDDASPISVLLPQFRVPTKARSETRRKRRRVFPTILAAAPARPPERGRRRCRHCEVEETPQWRMGPEGPKTLCNACGVRFKKGRLFPEYRPANSPTFSAGVHSNSTRRILEMRLGGRRRRRPGMRGRPRLALL